MRAIIMITLGLFGANLAAQEIELDSLRNNLFTASEERKICEKWYDQLQKKNLDTKPIHAGYLATLTALKAKYTINPYSKLKFFNRGRRGLEALIAKHPDTVELIFLRFTIQCAVPGFLNYSDELDKDLSFLLGSLGELEDESLRDLVAKYLIKSEQCSDLERERIIQYIQ